MNNHKESLNLDGNLLRLGNIQVINLGGLNNEIAVQNEALNYIDGDYVAIWDDRDIYLPWHLSNLIKYPLEDNFAAIQPKTSFLLTRHEGRFVLHESDNHYEASYILRTDFLRQHGFQLYKDPSLADPAWWHMTWFYEIRNRCQRPDFLDCGYVYVRDKSILDSEWCNKKIGRSNDFFIDHDIFEMKPIQALNVSKIFEALESLRNINKRTKEEIEQFLCKLNNHQRKGLFEKDTGKFLSCPVPANDHSRRKKKIYAFYHLWCQGEWRDLTKEMFNKFPPTLIERLELYVCASTDEFTKDCIPNIPENKINVIKSNKKNGFEIKNEWDTLKVLRSFCDSIHEDVPVLYFHSKGASYRGKNYLWPRVKDWNDMMLYFLVEKYQDALIALEFSDAVGCNLTYFNQPHFSGNFWMAWASHIRSLDYPSRFECKERYTAEFWIGTNPGARLQSLHTSIGSHAHYWHYYNSYPINKYEY
ncbi:MAG: hypothetical protein ACRESZ_18010 [Methylococcales bacterium]